MADARELVFSIKAEGADDSADKIKEVDKAMDGAKSKVGGLGGAMQTLGSGMQMAGAKIQKFGGTVMAQGKGITKLGKKVTRATAPLRLLPLLVSRSLWPWTRRFAKYPH